MLTNVRIRWISRCAATMVAFALAPCGCTSEKSPAKSPAKAASDGSEKTLVVAVSTDIPPYAFNEATAGLEIDILHDALPEYQLRFIQLPYDGLQTAIQDKKADISAGVHPTNDGGLYSKGFVSFANFAITKQAAMQKVESIADLKGHVVLTWEDADMELGSQFKELFGPDGSERNGYVPVADQTEQVRRFWEADNQVIVIDGSIFS